MKALNEHKEKYYYVVKVKIGIRRYVSSPPTPIPPCRIVQRIDSKRIL